MPLDFRYHVVSLIAVFLALALGTLVGFTLVSNPGLEEQVRKMGERLTEIRAEGRLVNEQLQKERQVGLGFSKRVLPVMLRGRLAGRRIAIITDHPVADAGLPQRLSDTLTQAGALVTSVTKIMRPFVSLRTSTEKAQALCEELQIEPAEGQDLRSLLASRLAEQLVLGLPEVPWRLARAGLIERSEDGNYQIPVDCVVLLTGPEHVSEVSVEKVDLPLVATCRQVNVRVVACEPRDTPNSMVSVFSGNIPTVDNVDTPPGQLALALTAGGKDGDYGVKDTADELLPAVKPVTSATPPVRGR